MKKKITELKLNPNNPRFIRDEKFEKLKKSLHNFPQMMEARPVVIDENNTILGGNMRYRAAKELGLKRLDYDYQHELIFFTWIKKHKYYGKGEFKTSVWNISRPSKSSEHPTMKPVALVSNALLNHTLEGDICIDFFLGSGTTMVACHQLNRKCYGIEIDPKYCQLIVNRMLKLDPDLKIHRTNIDGK